MKRSLLFSASAATALIAVPLLNQPANMSAEASPINGSEKPVTPSPYPERPLFGDTHLHTTNSFDAFGAGNRLSPNEALRFARGEEIISSSGIQAKLSRPLDFLVIADHSDAIGVTTDLYNTAEADLNDPVLKRWRNLMHGDRNQAYLVTREIIAAFQSGKIPQELIRPDRVTAMTRRIWDAQIDSVERYNPESSPRCMVSSFLFRLKAIRSIAMSSCATERIRHAAFFLFPHKGPRDQSHCGIIWRLTNGRAAAKCWRSRITPIFRTAYSLP
jgi:hypothetical protein